MAQPFRVIDGDDPGRDRGGWDENGNVDLPGVLTVDTIKGSGSSTPALTTVTFQSQVAFLAAVAFTATVLNLTGATAAADVLTANVTGDAGKRFVLDADGTLRWGDGTAAVDTSLDRSGANALETAGFFAMGSGQSGGAFSIFGNAVNSLKLGSAGGGVAITEGANARMGVSTLVGGTVVVANTSVTATTRIFLMCQTPGGTPGFLRVSARTAATSFTILSSSGTDTSVVAWLLVEPA
jgi:hypothetical protein